MTEIRTDRRFEKDAAKLPREVAEKLAVLIERLRYDPHDPALHIKQLHGTLSSAYSFRIGRDYRVLFSVEHADATTITLLSVDHRKDIYRKS